jgi:Major Facilitator Superfamily
MTATRTLPRPVGAASGPSWSAPSWSALTVLMFGTFMFVLDFFIVNVALPSIQQDLSAGEGTIEWVVAGYTISTAVLLVTGGRLGDQFGRRRVFSLGMAIFVTASAVCAVAPDPAVLVAARMVQGVGAALMAPNILSILGVVYTGPARIRAISIYGMVMGLAATSGQLIGGILIRADVAGPGRNMPCRVAIPGPVERTSSTGVPATISTAQAAHEQQSFSTATSLRSSSSTPGSGRKDMRTPSAIWVYSVMARAMSRSQRSACAARSDESSVQATGAAPPSWSVLLC